MRTMLVNRADGFSFIELLIAVAIMAGLFSVGLNSYKSFNNRTARGEVIKMIERLDAQQEAYQKENMQYARHISKLPMEPLMESGDYRLAVINAHWNRYVIEADPTGEGTNGKMAKDGKFRLTHKGVKSWDCKNDGTFSCTWEEAVAKE